MYKRNKLEKRKWIIIYGQDAAISGCGLRICAPKFKYCFSEVIFRHAYLVLIYGNPLGHTELHVCR